MERWKSANPTPKVVTGWQGSENIHRRLSNPSEADRGYLRVSSHKGLRTY